MCSLKVTRKDKTVKMVIMLSDKENNLDRQIAEILSRKGADVVLDNIISDKQGAFTVVNHHKLSDIATKKGIIIVTDSIDNLKSQHLPEGVVGICSEDNLNARKFFKANNTPVITCGRGSKNTLTVSSISEESMLLSLQRNIEDIKGRQIEPCEIKVNILKNEDIFSVLAATAVLLMYSITP